MFNFIRILIIGILLVLSHSSMAAQKEYPKTEEALKDAYAKLDYKTEIKKYSLANSRSEYQLPEGFLILLGEDAKQFLYLNNGTEFPKIDAVVLNPENYEQFLFSYFEAGYVRDGDWSDLDPDLLLEGILESTEEENIERRKNGIPPLKITGWAQKPIYDKKSKTAYWAIKVNDTDNGDIVNAIALKLGRKGFNKFVWIGEANKFTPSESPLNLATDNHSFQQGFRYADYSTGDKIAAVGLASLVAVTAGSKSGKGVVAGILATLLIFAKKLWLLIFLPFVFVWKWVKGLFGRFSGGLLLRRSHP